MQKKYGDARRTSIASDEGEAEYTAEDFIVEEDNVVLVSRDGWVKRQKEVKDVAATRVREGDAVMAVLPGSTRASVRFSNDSRSGPGCISVVPVGARALLKTIARLWRSRVCSPFTSMKWAACVTGSNTITNSAGSCSDICAFSDAFAKRIIALSKRLASCSSLLKYFTVS